MFKLFESLFNTKPKYTIGLSGRPHYRGTGICGRCGRKAVVSCCPIRLIPIEEDSEKK